MWLEVLAKLRRESGLSVVLALQATIMFVIAPLAATGYLAPTTVDVFRFGLAAAAVLMLARSRWTAVLITVTFCASIAVSYQLRLFGGTQTLYLFRIGVTSAFDLAVGLSVVGLVFESGKISVHRIMGGVILYLSIGLLFANIYRVADLTLHPAFSGLPPDRRYALSGLLYFSLGALTSSGFGDIAPVHPFVRSLANLESVIGQLYPATLLARLVSLHAIDGRGADRGDDQR